MLNLQVGHQSKSKKKDPRKKSTGLSRGGTIHEEGPNYRSFLGKLNRTQQEPSQWLTSIAKNSKRNSKDLESKHTELRRMLEKKTYQQDQIDKNFIKSKWFSNLKKSNPLIYPNPLQQSADRSLIDKLPARQRSKEVMHKIRFLFDQRTQEHVDSKHVGKRSNMKERRQRENSKDSKQSTASNDNLNQEFYNKSSSSKKQSRSASLNKNVKHLSSFYKTLNDTVEEPTEDHNKKIKKISKLYLNYISMIEEMDSTRQGPLSPEEQGYRSKIMNFFAFYSKMNTKAYLYTRGMICDSLSNLEQFIARRQETIKEIAPSLFASDENLELDEAVQFVINIAETLIEQNAMLSKYIKGNSKDAKGNGYEFTFDGKRKDMVRKFKDEESSRSNNKQEDDLNYMCNSALQKHLIEDDIGISSKPKEKEEVLNSKYLSMMGISQTPNTSKLGYQAHLEDFQMEDEGNHHEPSETSKKKKKNPLSRKDSKSIRNILDGKSVANLLEEVPKNSKPGGNSMIPELNFKSKQLGDSSKAKQNPYY